MPCLVSKCLNTFLLLNITSMPLWSDNKLCVILIPLPRGRTDTMGPKHQPSNHMTALSGMASPHPELSHQQKLSDEVPGAPE